MELEGDLEAETKGKTDAQRAAKKWAYYYNIFHLSTTMTLLLCEIHPRLVLKNFRNDRRAKDTQAQLDEERSNSQRLQTQVDQLNSKIKSVRRDKEEAEGEVETMQKKLRQLRAQLEEAEDDKSTMQAQMAKMRSAQRRTTKVNI